MTAAPFTRALPWLPDLEAWRRAVHELVAQLRLGKLECAFEGTLAAGQASTVFTHQLLGLNSWVLPMPLTANAADETGRGELYASSQGNGTVTFAHRNNAMTDRTFRFLVIGG
jgi:hypothetical protein